jgi:predicted nucleic acid-binding protein
VHAKSLAEVIQNHPLAAPIPVVADANVLMSDVCANLRRPEPTALLGLATEGRLRLLITDRVAHEIRTRMHRVAGDDLERALELWSALYLPLVRVVAVSRAKPELAFSPLLSDVLARDPDDVPTAYLALLCAPCAVVTKDRDLLDHGFGAPEWLTGLRASGELGELDQQIYDQTRMAGALMEAGFVGLARFARWTFATPWAAGALLALVVFGITDGRPIVTARIQRAQPGLHRFFELLADLQKRLAARRFALLERFEPMTLAAVRSAPLVASIAAQLAVSGNPLSAAQLSELTRHPEDEVRTILREHPAFDVVVGRGWQIGVDGDQFVRARS